MDNILPSKLDEKSNSILQLEAISKVFTSGMIKVTHTIAVDNISFTLKPGEVLSLVGESGSGKSTISNMILRIFNPTKGVISLEGIPIQEIPINQYYRDVQVVFQDPFSSFNYFYKVDRVLKMAVKFRFGKMSKNQRQKIIYKSLKAVALNPEEILGRYPHQLSGGQLQRFLLARVLIIKPKLLIADEPTSMIDACARAEVLNLLKKLKEEEGFSVLFITHDIGQAQYISDKVIVLNKGRIIETGKTQDVFLHPTQEYTQNLLESVPSLYRKWKS